MITAFLILIGGLFLFFAGQHNPGLAKPTWGLSNLFAMAGTLVLTMAWFMMERG